MIGRFAAKDLIHPDTGEVICRRNELFTEEMAAIISDAGIKSVSIRTNLTCDAKSGVCMMCYGRNLATNPITRSATVTTTFPPSSMISSTYIPFSVPQSGIDIITS